MDPLGVMKKREQFNNREIRSYGLSNSKPILTNPHPMWRPVDTPPVQLEPLSDYSDQVL